MKQNKFHIGQKSLVKYIYRIIIFMLALSGFAQMPVFKRYYIADIPGLGWLAKFYITHYIHYLFGLIFLALTVYIITDFFLISRKKYKITASGYIRAAIIAGLITSGTILVVKNFPGYHYSPAFIVAMDLIHLGLGCVFLATGLTCMILKLRIISRLIVVNSCSPLARS